MLDLIFIITAILANLLVVGIFFYRIKENLKNERAIGVIFQVLFIPLVIVFIGYIMEGRDLWILIYLTIALAFWIMELLLDYILKIDFRNKPKIHVPYIILFFIAFMGFVAISFVIDILYGVIVFITYCANLSALFYYLKTSKNKEE